MVHLDREQNRLEIIPEVDLNAENVEKVKQEWLELLEEHKEVGSLILNLERVKFIDSRGIGLVVGLSKECKDKHTRPFCVTGCTGQVRQTFTLVKLNKLLNIKNEEGITEN